MTNAYIYRAALLCEPCALKIRRALFDSHPEWKKPGTYTIDSDRYPHGPYPNGGGEADTPQHCDECRAFLENPLTDNGRDYVRDAIMMHARSGCGNPEVLAQWAERYRNQLHEPRMASSGYLNRPVRSEAEALADREACGL